MASEWPLPHRILGDGGKTGNVQERDQPVKINLIGVYGSNPTVTPWCAPPLAAIKKVRVGDTLDGGGRVQVTASEVRYQKGGRLVTLAMPGAKGFSRLDRAKAMLVSVKAKPFSLPSTRHGRSDLVRCFQA